jgi:hypothetical protein
MPDFILVRHWTGRNGYCWHNLLAGAAQFLGKNSVSGYVAILRDGCRIVGECDNV